MILSTQSCIWISEAKLDPNNVVLTDCKRNEFLKSTDRAKKTYLNELFRT